MTNNGGVEVGLEKIPLDATARVEEGRRGIKCCDPAVKCLAPLDIDVGLRV
jgi:hypothetical protein